ncbi:MAG: PBP1A family penicillin-binding protein [Spirochaetota bacterium]|nr:PBP1A family penicillin-binding protein [Spirochaetota bacterium]
MKKRITHFSLMMNFNRIEKIFFLSIMIFSLAGGLLFGYINAEVKNFSGINNLKKFQPSVPTRLYDVNGELIAELFLEKRNLVAFEELPKNLINAFIATEDREFFEHFGLNYRAIFRAMIKNIRAGRIVQGGSTITQQIAKRIFTSGERTFARKFLEALLALQIEKKFSKEEILEMYFNQIYLGHGCYGIASAARLFFDKEVKHLSLAEGSLLAALPSAPSKYSPFQNLHNAYEKNLDILQRMSNAGFLTKERAQIIYQEFWPRFIDSLQTKSPTLTTFSRIEDNAPYFTDYIRQILISRFGKDAVYNEGLSVYTTLNLKRQKIARKCLEEGLIRQNKISTKANAYTTESVDKDLFIVYNSLRNLFNLPETLVKDDIEVKFNKIMVDNVIDPVDAISLLLGSNLCNRAVERFREKHIDFSSTLNVEGAVVAIEPPTGYITTMIGGSRFGVDNQYNRAIQARRQTGSAFKPFVYGAGIASKIINAGTALPDAPIVDIYGDGDTWSPENYEGRFSGLVRVRNALAGSINIISVRIYDLVGPDRIIDFSSKMMKVSESRFYPEPSMALGSSELTPLELATGYSVYANMGRDVIPFAIRYVLDRDGNEIINIEEEVGNIIAQKEMEGTLQVIPQDVAYVMTSLMRSVVSRGTPHDAIRKIADFKKDCAGKTGTNTNWTDAWFCGFTPDVTAVVWIGYDKPFMTLGKHQGGSAVAAPIWGHYMKGIYNGMKDPEFAPEPPGVYHTKICKFSGLLPAGNCSEVISEIMIKGGGADKICNGNHFKMKSVLDIYMEKEGVSVSD